MPSALSPGRLLKLVTSSDSTSAGSKAGLAPDMNGMVLLRRSAADEVAAAPSSTDRVRRAIEDIEGAAEPAGSSPLNISFQAPHLGLCLCSAAALLAMDVRALQVRWCLATSLALVKVSLLSPSACTR